MISSANDFHNMYQFSIMGLILHPGHNYRIPNRIAGTYTTVTKISTTSTLLKNRNPLVKGTNPTFHNDIQGLLLP